MASLRMFTACFAFLLAAGGMSTPAIGSTAPIPVPELDGTAPFQVDRSGAATCSLEPGPLQASMSYAWTVPDAFSDVAWLIPRGSCAACGPTFGLELKTVSFRVRWFGACTATAQVSIVGATGAAGCRVPDPGYVQYGPASFQLVGTGSLGIVHTLPLPAGWCVGPDAFVRVHLVGFDACYPTGSSPGLARTTTACAGCSEYVSTTVSTPTLTDWCTLADGSLWMQIEADCCGPVGVGPEPAMARTTAIATLDGPARRVRMRMTLAEPGPVELSVHDIAGRRVRTLLRSVLDSGNHAVDWDGASDAGERLPAGVYMVWLRAGAARATATAVLLD